jgi:hypothetical protein
LGLASASLASPLLAPPLLAPPLLVRRPCQAGTTVGPCLAGA